MSFTPNLGTIERVGRIGLAAATLGPITAKFAGLNVPSWALLPTLVAVPVGVIMLLTSALAWCPIWSVAGISTVPKEKKN